MRQPLIIALLAVPIIIQVYLNDDRHREQGDNKRLPHDLLALKPEQQYQCGQQRDQ